MGLFSKSKLSIVASSFNEVTNHRGKTILANRLTRDFFANTPARPTHRLVEMSKR
jgi:hypothetical protein